MRKLKLTNITPRLNFLLKYAFAIISILAAMISFAEEIEAQTVFACTKLDTQAQTNCFTQILSICKQKKNAKKRAACFESAFSDPNSKTIVQKDDNSTPAETLPAAEAPSRAEVPPPTEAPQKITTDIVTIEETPAAPLHPKVIESPVKNDNSFGLKDPEIEFIEAKVTKIKTNSKRIRYFWLDNSHVWRELETNRLKIAIGDTVRIEEGAFSGFFLSKKSQNKRLKVKRVK